MSSGLSATREDRINELNQRIGGELATKTVVFHHAMADRLGLSASDLKCLDLLGQAEKPLTASNLVEATGLTGGAITGVADRLEAAGFVERVRDPEDRRRWELRPRPERQAEIAQLFEPLGAAMTELFAAYSDEDLELLTVFLTKLSVIIDDQTERLRH